MQQQNVDFTLRVSRTLIWQLSALVGVLLLLFFTGHAVLVAFGAILVATAVRGIATYLERFPFISARWSYPLVICAVLLFAGALSYFLGPRVLTQVHEIVNAIPHSLTSIRGYLETTNWGRDLLRLATQTFEEQRGTQALNYVAAFGELITDLIVIGAIGLFLGAHPQLYRNGLLMLFPPAKRTRVAGVLDDAGMTLRHWVLGQLIPMSVLGIGSLIGLAILDIPLAFTLALFTAAMLFIPYAGAIIAYVATALVAFAKGPTAVLSVTCVYLGIHVAEAYIITPLAQRHAVRLPAAITIFSQLLMWKLAGVLGVIVATPLAAVCLVLVQKLYVDRTSERRAAAGS